MDWWAALGAIGTLWAAVAASFAGYFTYRIMQAGQKQVEVSQEQFRQSVEAERDAQLPVLMPTAPLQAVGHITPGLYGAEQPTRPGYDRTQPYVRVVVKNVGQGLALNVWGIIFGPEPELEIHKVTGQVHANRYRVPLAAGEDISLDWTAGGPPLSGDTEIGTTERRYKLYAPHKPTLAEVQRGTAEKVARLTFTYTDLFGRKHAAIYDLTAEQQWENVAYLRDIPKDLADLEREALRNVPVYAVPPVPTA